MTSPRLLLVLTGSRLVFAAGFAGAVLAGTTTALLPLALLAELSDLGDGLFARKTGSASLVGNIYDGMADHVARMTEFVCLSALGAIGLFPILVFLWRDGAVATTRLVAAISDAPFPTTRASGKIKGIAQGGCIVWLSATQTIPAIAAATGAWLSSLAVWVAVSATVISALDYMIAHRSSLGATVASTPQTTWPRQRLERARRHADGT